MAQALHGVRQFTPEQAQKCTTATERTWEGRHGVDKEEYGQLKEGQEELILKLHTEMDVCGVPRHK